MADVRDLIREASFDFVRIDGFTAATSPFIWDLVEALDGSDPAIWAQMTTACELFFVLRHLPEDAFPGGKWATIQHLEGQIDEAVRAGLDRVGIQSIRTVDPRHLRGESGLEE